MQAADSGPVTRSRRNLLGESSEKESSNNASGTPSASPNVEKMDTTMSSTPPKIRDADVHLDSPGRLTRNRRSISLATSLQDSPKRNLRKRAVSPENKLTPVKNMTPTKKLKKNETNLLITFDSPKPRRGRLSLDAPALDTSNLRRSRRLSTELNVVQEDPIKEAEVEALPASQPTKGRRGKRLSVLPSQPSVPEESEESIGEAKIIDVENLQTIKESSESCKIQDLKANVNVSVCIQKLVLVNDEREQNNTTDGKKLPLKEVNLSLDSVSRSTLRKSSLDKSNDKIEDLNANKTSLNSSQKIKTNTSVDNIEDLNTSKKSLNKSHDLNSSKKSNESQENIQDVKTGRKSLNKSIDIIEEEKTSKKSLNRSKNIIEDLNTSKTTLNESQENVQDVKTDKKSLNETIDNIEDLNASKTSLNRSKNNIEDLNTSKKLLNKGQENIKDLNTSKNMLNMSQEMVQDLKARKKSLNKSQVNVTDINDSQKSSSDCEDNIVHLNRSGRRSSNISKENIDGKQRSQCETPDNTLILAVEEKSENCDDSSDKSKCEKTQSISIDDNTVSKIGKRSSLPRDVKKKNSIGDCSVLSVNNVSTSENLETRKLNETSEKNIDDPKTINETILENDNVNVSEKKRNSNSKSLLEKSIDENLDNISVISTKRISISDEGNKNNISGSMNISQQSVSEKNDKSASKSLLDMSADENLNISKNNTSLNSSKKTASEFFVEEKSQALKGEKDISNKNSSDNHNSSSEKENANASQGGKKRKSIDISSPKLSINKSNSQMSAITSTPLVINKLNDSLQSAKKNVSKLSQIDENEIEEFKEKHSISTDSNFDSDSTEDDLKITFLDSAASDAGSDYKSGDSLTDSERMEIVENEVIERGESLNSENSLTDADSDDTYEKDSFICSSDEEDEILLSGTGEDLSSGAELSQSKESKKKYDAKEKKKQKMASREMYEARHGTKSKKHNSSGKNNFILSSSEDDEEEKEISIKNTSSITHCTEDPLKMTFIENAKNSSGDEDVKNVKTNYEVLKRLRENNTIVAKDSDSDNEIELVNEVLNNHNGDANVEEKSETKSNKLKRGLNKSDIMKVPKKGTESKMSKSLNLGSDSTANPISMQESMERLLTLNKSLSKVFTSLINDVDKLKDTVYDGTPDASKNKNSLTDAELSIEVAAEVPISESKAASDLVESTSLVNISKTSQLEKRKLDTSDDQSADNGQSKKIKVSVDQGGVKAGKSRNSQEALRKKSDESKYKLSQQSKLIKKTKQTKDYIGKILKTKDGNSIFDFKVRPKSPALKNKITSTSQFLVEDLKSTNEVRCTETAGKFSVMKTKQERQLCKLNLGSTTNFAIASLKSQPKQIARVDSDVGNEFVYFKNDLLYGKNIRRETSREMLKKQQKTLANQKSRRMF